MAREKSRVYTSADFQVPRNSADDAAGILITYGAMGCEVRNLAQRTSRASGVNPPVLLRAYFAHVTPAGLKRLQAKLEQAGMLADHTTPARQLFKDPGWATMWQARFAPLRIGQRFLIVPPWLPARAPGRLRLVIRPGRAFGTGHHPSTSGTLSALEELCAHRSITRALDVGTGSGILAIAMVRLGVAAVTAIDNDPAAVANARDNLRLNRVTAKVRLSTASLAMVHARFGLIAANILGSTLIRMAPDLKARLRRGGHLVLAGILRREADAVIEAYLPELACVEERAHGAWTTLTFSK